MRIVKKLFSDGDVVGDTLTEHIPAFVVRFSQLPSSDSFEVVRKSKCENMSLY